MGAEDEGNPPPPPTAGQPATVAGAAPITPAQFLSWKQRKSCKIQRLSYQGATDIASGAVQMNGRELFQHEPWVFDNNIY